MPAFDASALVPLFVPGHPHEAPATVRFEEVGVVLVHPCVLAEMTTALRREAKNRGLDGNETARAALEALLAEPRVRVEPALAYDDAIARYLAFTGLSLTDAIVAELRWHHDRQEPVTFDRDLLRAARATSKEVRQMLTAQREAKAP